MRVTVAQYSIEIPENGRATLYEADLGGDDHEVPFGVDRTEALIEFAREVQRLRDLFSEKMPGLLAQVKQNHEIVTDANERLNEIEARRTRT